MTELKKPITREVPAVQIKGRPLMITLLPPDKIQLWPKGMRQVYTVPIDACFWLAAKAEAERQATMDALKTTKRRTRRNAE